MAAVRKYPVGITNESVARDAPRLMASDARAMITACVLAVLVVTGRFGWWMYRHRIVLLFLFELDRKELEILVVL
jgi:hypothetical protein